ncbi:MAG: undecaprenyl-diphosphate phosphatase [Candidatus Auribacterota bacterium]
MTLISAIILGIVQGLTEFLPISSSGHLVLLQEIIHIDKPLEILFDVTVHLGTLVAVVLYYFADIRHMITTFLTHSYKPQTWGDAYKNNLFFKLCVLIILSTFITGVIGLSIKDFIEELFLDNPRLVAVALCCTACILLSAELIRKRSKALSSMIWLDALIIGVAQAIALTPGISRSGMTIACAVWLGFTRLESARYSFLLAIPAILAGFTFQVHESISMGFNSEWFLPLITGWISAVIAGIVAIKLILLILKDNRLHWFSLYCVAVAIAVFIYFR